MMIRNYFSIQRNLSYSMLDIQDGSHNKLDVGQVLVQEIKADYRPPSFLLASWAWQRNKLPIQDSTT